MLLRPVDPKDYADKGVPLLLIKAVNTINDLIAIDKHAVTEALGSGDRILCPEAYTKMVAHPYVIVGERLDGMFALSGLGILNGLLMTPRFRLYIEVEDENHIYKSAGIMEDMHWKEGP